MQQNSTTVIQNVAVLELAICQLGSFDADKTFQILIPKFLDYLKYDLLVSGETVDKYSESLGWIIRHLPHLKSPTDLKLEDITELKKKTLERGCGQSRVNSFVYSLRKFLTYCHEVHKIVTIDPKEIKPMKVPKRQVEFLTKEEIGILLNSFNTKRIGALRMKALMELLIATGMRIGEALSLNRDSIDPQTHEAVIVGKGNKQRTVFVTQRAMEWIQEYLARRRDDNPALFLTFGTNNRLQRYDLGQEFRHYATKAGIKKTVTPHILRHTMATLMLHNGANIMDIKELLGHADIKTTATYYLGTDKRALKSAHEKFLDFSQ